MPGQVIDPSVLSITQEPITLQQAALEPVADEPKVEATEVPPQAEVEATPEKEQSKIPEKFKTVEDMVKSYEHLETELTKKSQKEKELEHKIWAHEEAFKNQNFTRPIQQPNEEEVFQQEWEQDPRQAMINQNRRLNAKIEMSRAATNTTLFYENAKKDEINYPGFRDYEPRMIELANQNAHLVDQRKINSPEVMDLLYKLARAEKIGETVNQSRIAGSKEAETRRKETQRATFESPTPVSSSSQVRPEDMTLEQLEKELGFAKRA